MPTRMIREGLLDSDRYARVSDASRLLFVHLLLLADDFGCVSVSATFLRRRCFYDSPSDERIARLICELVDVDLIRTYEVERTCLAFIPKFRQRLYRSTLKHAIPPESLYKDDLDATAKFNEISKEITKTPVLPPEYPVVPPPEEKRREVKRSKTLSGNPDVVEVLNFLNLKAKRNYQPVRANVEMIQARLAEGFTPAELKQVVAKKCREWTDDKMREFLRPKTLFSRTNFANYAGELVDAP